MTSRSALVREITKEGDGIVDFQLLERGMYRVRAIHDINGDGKWTTGSYRDKIQPEPVTYYPDELEIKINWEIQEDWNLYDFYLKNPEMKSIKR